MDQIFTELTVVGRIREVVQHVPAERARAAVGLAREVDADSVITIGGGSGTDVRVLSRVVVYDAALSQGLPPDLAIHSGLNALAHAVDSLWARERVLYGTYLAAVALTSAGAGMHHKICHVLGGTFNLPRAPTHAVVLPYVAAYSTAADPGSEVRIAEALGTPHAAPGLWDLARELGAPDSLAEIGFAEESVALAAELSTAAIPASNPQQVSLESTTRLLRSALRGDDVR